MAGNGGGCSKLGQRLLGKSVAGGGRFQVVPACARMADKEISYDQG